MAGKSDQGKFAEGKVRTFLKKVSNSRANFIFDRIPDARSSRGRSGQKPADFAAFCPGIHAWIDPKEVKHDFRIPKSRLSQIPMLRLREAAGGTAIFLIYHTTTKLWRCPPFHWLVENMGDGKGSYDLSEFPTYKTVDDALTDNQSAIFFIRK